MKKLESKWLYIPGISLILFLLIKFIEKTRIIWEFPFDRVNDLSSYMAYLHFLKQYGYHQIVPNWYNGLFKLFEVYPPGWYFFTYPIYLITGRVESATIISMFLTLLIGFWICWYFGNKLGFSKLERIVVFALIFGNPMAIGNFIRLGRPHELFAWAAFAAFLGILLMYKDKEIDKKFLWIIILYSLIMLSHTGVFVLTSSLFLGLLLIKSWREWKYIFMSGLATAVITAFWWVGFLKGLVEGSALSDIYSFAHRLVSLNPKYLVENVTSLVTPLAFLIIFYLYYKTNKNRKELLFFLPQLILGILFLTRIIVLIPLLNRIYPDIYNMFFIMNTAYLIFKVDYGKLSLKLKSILVAGLIILPILAIIAYLVLIPGFVHHTVEDKETLELLGQVEGKFLILKSGSLAEAFYTYGAIYNNLSTPLGWSNPSAPQKYVDRISKIQDLVSKDKCPELRNELRFFNTTSVITYREYCDVLEECKLREKVKKEHSCLYVVR